MAATVIRNFIAKALFKKQGAIANNKAVDFSANALEQRLKNLGIDPNRIRSEQELNQILGLVKQAEDQAFNQRFGNVLSRSNFERKGEVFDMTGQKIDPRSKIMGGKQAETEAEILARINKENKKGIASIKNRKMVEEAIDNASPGFVSGDRKYNAQLVADDLAEKKFGKEFYDLDQKQQMDLYDEALEGLANQKRDMPDPEDFSTGGRAGFKGGSYDYNSFDHKINELKAAYKRYKKGLGGRKGGVMTFEQFAPLFAAENFATGGRAGFKTGLGKRFLELLKNKKMFRSKDDVPTSIFSEKKGPITLTDLENIPEDQLRKIRRTQELGLYTETPEILKAGNLFERFTKKVGGKRVIDYDRAGFILNRKLRGDETLNELLQIEYQTRPGRAEGGRAGFKAGLSKALLEFMKKFKVKQSGDDVKDFLSKRQFMKDIVGNTKANEKARQLTMLKEMAEEYQKKKFGKFEFPSDEQIKIDLEKRIQPILNKSRKLNATGGRIGLKAGMTKRAFLKLIGGTGAAIGALKSGIFSGFGKGAGKQVAKEVVQKSTSTPPPYFFELANKIKTLGKPDKVTYADRVEIHRYRGKNGDEYELIEDLSTGDVRITKDKTGMGSYNDKNFDTIEDRTVLEYKKGDADVDPETGTAFKSADEYEEYKVEFDADGTPADATELDAVVQKEIIEEATGEAPSIKKAGGGIARMLGE